MLTLNCHFSVTSVKIHLRNLRFFRKKLFDEIFRIINGHHFVNWSPKDYFSLDTASYFPNEAITAGERTHLRRNDRDISCLKVDGVFDISWNNLRDFILQLLVGHLHLCSPKVTRSQR